MSKSEKFLYFAFGSNLLKERLQLNNPSAVYITIAQLKDYKLSFWAVTDPTQPSSRWFGAGANIEEAPGSCVWGTVWELDVKDLPSLDRQEGCYVGKEVHVLTPDNTQLTCRTYQMMTGESPCQWDTRPSPQYLDIIIRGACQSNLPDDYIQGLKRIEHNGYKGQVDVYNKTIRMMCGLVTSFTGDVAPKWEIRKKYC